MKLIAKVSLIGMSVVVMLLPESASIAAPVVTKPEAALRQAFPQIPVDNVQETEVKGVYEATSGQNVFFFQYFPEKDYLFVGDIYTKDGKSLAKEKKQALSARLISTLPLEKAVKLGNGKTTVIEFTDPDCPFCKKASEYLKGRTDVTRYIFFAPLAHPAAITKIYYILNATDKAKAYAEVMEGKVTPPASATYSDAIKELAQEHLALAKMVGVQGTPTFFINGTEVVGADIPQFERLLKDGGQK
jgi:thiol:disulfide interchange protein DsbC